jgi:tetratricopeptide (TPR) repeat protein
MPEPEPRAATAEPEPPVRVEPTPKPVRAELSESIPAALPPVRRQPAPPPEPVVAEETVQPEPVEEEAVEVELPAAPEPPAEPLAAAQAASSSPAPAPAPDVSDRVAARGSSAPRSSSSGYEIAPLGSIHTDPAERALIARRVQKRLDQRYAQLVERHKPQTAAVSPGEATAARALEAESWFRKGSEFLKVKKYDEAVEAFGMSAHHDPSEGEYVAHLGYALYLSKPDNELVRKEALEDIARGIKLSPDRELPYVYLGRIFKVQGKIDDARKMFERALKIRPHCRLAAQEIRLMDMRDKKKNAGLLSRFLK